MHGVQFLRLVDADEVAGAGDDREVCVGDLLSEVLGDREEVRLVVCAHDDERRDSKRRQRRHVGPLHLGLLVRGLQLESPALLRAHLVAMGGRDPELQVDLGRGVEIAGLDRSLLRREVVAHLLGPVPSRQSRPDEHEPFDPVLMRERGAQCDRSSERVADQDGGQFRCDHVDERERLGR